jgi:protein involved in polysaccharide export with SLBB domain
MRGTSKKFVLPILLVLCGACSTNGAAPVFEPDRSVHKPSEYRIQIGDQLGILFTFNERLNQEVTVRPDGRISLPLVDDLQAATLTPRELSTDLESRYAEQLENPAIAVILRVSAQRVFVFGEVTEGGAVPWIPELTALQAAAQVGGFTDRARMTRVILIRRDQAAEINLKEALMNPKADVYLEPYDTLYVPLSGVARVNRWVDQYIRRNIPIPVTVRFKTY